MSSFWKRETKFLWKFWAVLPIGIIVPLAEVENIKEEQEMALKRSWDWGIISVYRTSRKSCLSCFWNIRLDWERGQGFRCRFGYLQVLSLSYNWMRLTRGQTERDTRTDLGISAFREGIGKLQHMGQIDLLAICINKVLLFKHSHAHSFTYCQWLHLPYKVRVQ